MDRDLPRTTFTKSELGFLAAARVARLATADAHGIPHIIPIVFVLDGLKLYTPLDAKPKRVALTDLKRVRNLRVNPRVAVVVDQYDEDWTRLAWVMVKGKGALVEKGEVHAAGIRLLENKYPQYTSMPLTDRPLIVVTPLPITSWGAV